ncbi:hypothetical protein SLEP1_g4464 [Rubroshorea leprosula]|uniref:Uncharacterized protein n=1 Tax=Rubroshorea leprosula TaxID=152421 RepID=A0AAV5HZ95_9ROSI|nr:hypothetical protein SLEP1_g4464 [Rubroshorea leprosula]
MKLTMMKKRKKRLQMIRMRMEVRRKMNLVRTVNSKKEKGKEREKERIGDDETQPPDSWENELHDPSNGFMMGQQEFGGFEKNPEFGGFEKNPEFGGFEKNPEFGGFEENPLAQFQ